ncbi:SIR2 family protein [Microbulbifer bruguierae]|uniref:SIR2 family protein n=1 Tax=Microbulbifer bruguierae TaxID=3029061 RepID=A0ABY8NF62_9GAMM|nr:SIR2 family protein [Microbulbifer bruguierae]WGL17232.1 SIR2 family protein [Microbulbifer bruguierae]
MDSVTRDTLTQLDNLLAASNQSWLFGAGISLDAGIPLMWPLTERVFSKAQDEGEPSDIQVLEFVKKQLSEDSHIEHILSQLGDHRAIADRSKDRVVRFDEVILSVEDLDNLHQRILRWIAETIRWGYVPAKAGGDPEKIGSLENRIVIIDHHAAFVSSLFNRSQAGVAERRRAVRLFTTNYDTLLEDALALGGFSYWDGFAGGAVAYRNHRYGDEEPNLRDRAHVIKLHGSIDWHLGEDGRVWRVRDGDIYPKKASRVLIYPQSTKYLATQRDPFAAQFDLFRRAIGSHEENILATCGYSFGDEHINQEIELALQRPENKTTLLAFAQKLNPTLEKWRMGAWGKRVYVISEDGLFVGAGGPYSPPTADRNRDWWTFSGVTKLLNSGAEASVR